MFGIFRKPKLEQVAPAPAPVGATFGPWAEHHRNCRCNVCG